MNGTSRRGPVKGSGEASRPLELALAVDRDALETLGAQIEGQLDRAIRDGELRAGTRIASTRDLARRLSVSRRVAVGVGGGRWDS